MSPTGPPTLHHSGWSRREILQAGTLGLMGLSMSDVERLRAESGSLRRPRAVIYVFLTGGLAQHESFDPKPNATENVRGEFTPISTRTPGLQICEHLPLLADRSDKWALCRSVSHSWNEHSQGTCLMLTGRSQLPPSFSNTPKPSDFPGITAMGGRMAPGRNGLPGAAVLPYPIKQPGTLAGRMGPRFDPWMLNAASNCKWSGACPNCWDHQRRPEARHTGYPVFRAPNLTLADGLSQGRIDNRKALLGTIERQQQFLDGYATVNSLDRYRTGALSLLTSGRVRRAFDIENADPKALDRYGRNLFGYSLLMAARLVEVGVSMVQVNLGRGGFDTHGNAFDHLKNLMLPPTDQALSALLDDLDERGLLEDTLVVAAGEFGRTPRVFNLPQYYELPGRDHWGAVQSVFFAGAGANGGKVIGSSDADGGQPKDNKQTPESMAATIYDALGIDRHATWDDNLKRPHAVYHGNPIEGMLA